MTIKIERKIKKVCIYVRKSREEETDEILQRQLAVLIELCKKNGWEYEIFMEVGSSQNLDRPELQKMLEKIKLFYYDGCVIADMDRLSRNTGHFAQIKEIFISVGCLAITPNKIYDFTKQEDDLFSDLQSVLNKNEYQTIKRRLIRGTRQSAKDGNWQGKKVPIGYRYQKEKNDYNGKEKRLVLSEDAPVIKRMFEEYLNGLSTTEIAYKFTFENVYTTVGMIWTSAGVSRLINNPVYCGDSVYGRTTKKDGKRGVKTDINDQIIINDTHEPIIDRETWEKVQQIKLERNSKPIPLKLGKHKFSGLIRCGLCGRVHSFQTSRYKRKRINSCQTRHYGEDRKSYSLCENQGCNIKDFEKVFYGELELYCEQLEQYIELLKQVRKKDNKEKEIESIERQIKKIDQDIKRVQNGYKMEIYTEEEAHKEIKQYRQQKDTLELKLNKLNENQDDSQLSFLEQILQKIKYFLSGKDDMPEQEANDILNQFIEVIVYNKHDDTNFKVETGTIYKNFLPTVGEMNE